MRKEYLILFAISVMITSLLSCTFKNPVDTSVELSNIDSLKLESLDDRTIEILWIGNDEVFGYKIERKDNINNNWEIIYSIEQEKKGDLNYTYKDSLLKYQLNNEIIIYSYRVYGHCDENITNVEEDSCSTIFPGPTNLNAEQMNLDEINLHWSQDIFTDELSGYIIERKDTTISTLCAPGIGSNLNQTKFDDNFKVIAKIDNVADTVYSDLALSDSYSFIYRIKSFTILSDTSFKDTNIFNESLYLETSINRAYLSLSSDSIDFGEVYVNKDSVLSTVLLENIGSVLINISSINITGENPDQFYYSPDSLDLSINPGDTLEIAVWYKPTFRGDASALLQINSDVPPNDGKMISEVSLKGFGLEGDLDLPDSLYYGEVGVGQTLTKTMILENIGNASLQIDTLYLSNGSEYKIESQLNYPFSINANESLEIELSFKPTIVDQATDTLFVKDNISKTDRNLSQVVLSGIGIVNALVIHPNPVNFYKVNISDSSMTEVMITNISAAETRILHISITGVGEDNFTFDFSPGFDYLLSPGDSIGINVIFKPINVGQTQANLIIYDDINQTRNETSVELLGEGASGNLSIEPDSIFFEKIDVGSTVNDTLILLNAGNSSLIINSIYIDGSSDFNYNFMPEIPYTLSSLSSVQLEVSYTPADTGAVEGTITIVDNVPGGGKVIHTVTLAGTGVQGDLIMSSTSLSFGDVLVDSTETETLTLTNTGTGSLEVTDVDFVNDQYFETNFAFPQTLDPGASIELLVSFTTTLTGVVTDTLIIEDNVAGGSRVTHEVALSGTGISAPRANYILDIIEKKE